MWSLLLKLLESIARIRIPFYRFSTTLSVGRPNAADACGTNEWRAFLEGRALSRVWGPHAKSPWTPFHILTLFVSLDYLRKNEVGPCDSDPWPIRNFQIPPWIDSSTLLLIDLPGPQSVALGAALAVGGCDLVCTFNNWPHPKGLIRPEETLAALLRYASWLSRNRTAYPAPGPVAWLCDSGRLGVRRGRPNEFDNRYYIEDNVVPGPNYLRERNISKIIYISGGPEIIADLGVHLYTFKKEGFQVGLSLAYSNGVLADPVAIVPPEKPFNTTGFFRATAGGFGAPVPHPSSGG